jgi:hypothetical protein
VSFDHGQQHDLAHYAELSAPVAVIATIDPDKSERSRGFLEEKVLVQELSLEA